MRASISITLSALLAGLSAPAVGAGYQPVSDELLRSIVVNPKSPAEIERLCDARLAGMRAVKARLEKMPLSSDPMTILSAYDDLYTLALSAGFGEPGVIKDTHPDASIRKAAEDCVQRVGVVQTEIGMSRPIFDRLQAAERTGVAPELRYLLRRQIDNFRRSGVDKDEATRKRIADLQKAVTETGLEFDRNINDSSLTITAKPEELDGLPQDYLAAHPPGADGLVRFTTAYPDYYPVMRYVKSAPLRKRTMEAFLNRAYPANDAVLRRMIDQRAELAGLLGYRSYADYDLANRMVGSPDRARSFLEEIAVAARPAGQADAARMLARLQKDDPALSELGSWNSTYANRLIRTEDYQVDPQIVRQYLAFDKVRGGIFKLTEDLFGVEIRPWQTEVWSPEVKAYELVEAGEVIGRFYLDMHPRPNKYSHAAMFPVRIGVEGRTLPLAALLCNFPTGLMEHGDVVTFLHEFGHLLHWMFSGKVKFAAQNIVELENDVIEAPSQLLEEWVWDYETLKSFATNDKGEPIPADLVARMNAGRKFGEALGALGQLGYSAASLDYYSGRAGADLTATYRRAYDRYALTRDPEGVHTHASFGHLGGYGAAYYTYSWSKALASDLLSRFRAEGLRNRETAAAYRHMILAPGGSDSMNVLANRFLGRDWSVEAYRQELQAGGN